VFLPCISAVGSADASRPGAVENPPHAQRGRRVLVVDDNADAAESIEMLLRLSGHETRVVTEAAQVMATAAVFAPHVAILDIGLPGLSGYDLARKLRQEAEHADLILIALTGYGQIQDREKAVAAGFDHYFVKPVDPAQLDAAIGAAGMAKGQLSPGATRVSG
jgi:DNA-binding response OmpR family regulator